jgi:hypothetical protein
MRLAPGVRTFLLRVAASTALTLGVVLGAAALTSACQTGGVAGNDKGSAPINAEEANDYKKAVNRCYKTGGTRVVKIMGQLRCY